MDGKRYAVETGRPQRRLKNQKGLQNINQSPDNMPGTEVSKRAYTARCKRAFRSLIKEIIGVQNFSNPAKFFFKMVSLILLFLPR